MSELGNINTRVLGKKNLFICWKEEEIILGDNSQEEPELLKKKRIRLINPQLRQGRWDEEEHNRFLKACFDHGEDWPKIEATMKTRNTAQIRSHAQKYLIKLCRKYSIKLNKKKFKNKKSLHLQWNEKEDKTGKNKKLDISQMSKYDLNILNMFRYYDRDYSTVLKRGDANSNKEIRENKGGLSTTQPKSESNEEVSSSTGEFNLKKSEKVKSLPTNALAYSVGNSNSNTIAEFFNSLQDLSKLNQKNINFLYENSYNCNLINNQICTLISQNHSNQGYLSKIKENYEYESNFLKKLLDNFQNYNTYLKNKLEQELLQNILKTRKRMIEQYNKFYTHPSFSNSFTQNF